jgi:hypothetical protein
MVFINLTRGIGTDKNVQCFRVDNGTRFPIFQAVSRSQDPLRMNESSPAEMAFDTICGLTIDQGGHERPFGLCVTSANDARLLLSLKWHQHGNCKNRQPVDEVRGRS